MARLEKKTMRAVQRLRIWIGAVFQKRQFDVDMDEEMRAHVEMRTRENIQAGMQPKDARLNALRQFGWTDSIKETCRDERGVRWIENLLQDIRFGARQLRKNPGFTTVAVLTLALGIGVNTSMFSAIQATMIRALPYPEPGSLVRIFSTSPHSRRGPHSTPNFLDYRVQNTVFDPMTALNSRFFNLAEPGQPAERVRGAQTSTSLFSMLRIRPEFGRVFSLDEDQPGRDHVALLSHGLWLRRFAGDTNILGRVLRLDGEPVKVVGVMPDGFDDPRLAGRVDVWRPLVLAVNQFTNRSQNWLQTVARLKPGVSLAQAQAEMDILGARMAKAYPDDNLEKGLRLLPLARSGKENGRRLGWLMMGLAGIVLLIACANLANLQLARSALRGRELAVRGALGAHRGRLLRQLLTESLLIAFLGGLLGLVLAEWSNQWLGRQLKWGNELGVVLPLDTRMLGFTFVASTLAGLVFGLAPAWLASRTNVNQALKQVARGTTGDRSQHRLQHSLIVGEVALALVLLTGAGLVLSGLRQFASRDPGWCVEELTLGKVNLPEAKYSGPARRLVFAENLQNKLGALPGVERLALAWFLPIRSFDVASTFAIEGRPEPPQGREPIHFNNVVTPGYFTTLGMRLLRGRDFTSGDTTNGPAVVIINEAMASMFWPGESPIGQRIGGTDAWQEIVGVVSDVRFPGEIDEPMTRFQTYRPLAQLPPDNLAIAIRGHVNTESLRRAVAELDPDLPINDSGPARAAVASLQADYGPIGWLLSGFAGLGLLLAGLGIYGVMASFVAQRTNEIGVRMALGAQVREVLWLVIRKGLGLALLGAATGAIGACGVARLLASVSPELAAKDPFTFVCVTLLLVSVAALACWLPARRAAHIDPMVALRNE